MTWQLQEAKNKFSQVVDTTLSQGPQIISRRGKNTVVIVSFDDYRAFMSPEPKLNFKQCLQKAPVDGLEITRNNDVTGRATEIILE